MRGRTRVLLVEDDPLVGAALLRSLRRTCDVILATNIADAFRVAAETHPDAVVTDYDLEDEHGRDGLWLLDRLRLPGVVLTGHHLKHAHHRVLRKPITPAALYAEIEALLATAQV